MLGEELLIIFVKNPEAGKVKTRLAKEVGDEKALKIYRTLLSHTNAITKSIEIDKSVFYSNCIDEDDLWSNHSYKKFKQQGKDLGEKMLNAFELAYKRDYKRVVIIGSDCKDLTTEIIENAFEQLKNHDVVIGPASDGGYYLLGMNKLYPELFTNKEWSTENVLLDTLIDIKALKLSHAVLETLNDIDYKKDLGELENLIK